MTHQIAAGSSAALSSASETADGQRLGDPFLQARKDRDLLGDPALDPGERVVRARGLVPEIWELGAHAAVALLALVPEQAVRVLVRGEQRRDGHYPMSLPRVAGFWTRAIVRSR